MRTEIVVASAVVLIAFCQIDGVSSKTWVKKKHLTKRPVLQEDAKFYDTAAGRKHTKMFAPTAIQCCKLGERIGRKKLSCNPEDYHPEAVSGPGNKDRKRDMVSTNRAVRTLMKKLSGKVDSCVGAKYSGNFTKCCNYKENMAREIQACKRHLRRMDRKKCRKTVRKMFH